MVLSDGVLQLKVYSEAVVFAAEAMVLHVLYITSSEEPMMVL